MTNELYRKVEQYMRACMNDNVHDSLHIYRVLNYALQIVSGSPELNADVEIVIIAALLHDIGRDNERRDASVCHAESGGNMAHDFLISIDCDSRRATHIVSCIRTHRYNVANPPKSVEARILFDADKLDLTGTIGTARAILFGGQIEEPLYLLGADGKPTKGAPDENASLFREYNRKLSALHTKFHTQKAREIAVRHQKSMDSYFQNLMVEVKANHEEGNTILRGYLEG